LVVIFYGNKSSHAYCVTVWPGNAR